MFSSDLSDGDIRKVFDVHKPLAVIVSNADEYVPPKINMKHLSKKWKALRPDVIKELHFLDGNHALDGQEAALADLVVAFIH